MDNEQGSLDFENLRRRFEIPLLQYAMRIMGDQESARDVVQETFIQLQSSDRKQTDCAPAKWLFTVCRNRALNICRKKKRLTYLDEGVLERQEASDATPSDSLEQREAKTFLLRIVATLPPRQQEVLQLKFQNDLSYQEIAEITNTTANSVGVLIHTALKNLRARYANESKEFVPFTSRATQS